MNPTEPDDGPLLDDPGGFEGLAPVPLGCMGVPGPNRCRRPCWTAGAPVTLADGRLWHLPILTPAIVATVPGLAEAIEATWATAMCYETAEDRTAHAASLGHAGRLMIAANYDLRSGTGDAPTAKPGELAGQVVDQFASLHLHFLFLPLTFDQEESVRAYGEIIAAVEAAICAADAVLRPYLASLRPHRRVLFAN